MICRIIEVLLIDRLRFVTIKLKDISNKDSIHIIDKNGEHSIENRLHMYLFWKNDLLQVKYLKILIFLWLQLVLKAETWRK